MLIFGIVLLISLVIWYVYEMKKTRKEKYKGNKKGFIKYLLVSVFTDWIEFIWIPILFLILWIVFTFLG